MLLRPTVAVSQAMPAALCALFIIFTMTYLYRAPGAVSRQHLLDIPAWHTGQKPVLAIPPPSHSATPPPLPVEYDNSGSVSEYCDNRHNVKYLANIRDASFQYCNASSFSSFTCFHSHTSDDHNRDSLCITRGTLLDTTIQGDKKFLVDCNVQPPDESDMERGIIPLAAVRQYWYDTGPKYIMNKHFDFTGIPQQARRRVNEDDDARLFTLLIKREGEGNPWHCLMEIWSMTMTMDILRTSVDPADSKGRPFFRVPEDVDNLQVVILDDRVDGPYFDLWKLFSGRDPIRLNQIQGNPEASEFFNNTNQRLILPLAGATNPMWQNDWKVRDCTQSDTLRAFSRRVLEHYNIHTPFASAETDQKKRETVRVTIIDRKDAATRRLVHQDALLAKLRDKYPDVDVQEVDFGTMSFAEQLAIAQATDVLVGVHGAGLTHTMFLREQSTAIVEIQPNDMGNVYMGFRNMANMRGVSYFRAEASPASTEPVLAPDDGDMNSLSKRASWHTENFEINPEIFVRVVGAGIQAVFNKNMHSHEIS